MIGCLNLSGTTLERSRSQCLEKVTELALWSDGGAVTLQIRLPFLEGLSLPKSLTVTVKGSMYTHCYTLIRLNGKSTFGVSGKSIGVEKES